MDTLNSPMGFDVGLTNFPSLHFTVRNGELIPNYSHSGGGLIYDSPPITRRPKLQKQSSLDETNRKKHPTLHSPPMKKKSVPSSPPIDENEVLVNDFVLVDANDNEIVETDKTEDGVPSVKEKKKKRKVSFADALGKELEQVKIFEEPEYILPIRPKEPEPELLDLELMDPLPEMESEIFNSRFEKKHLILEKLNLGTVNIAGRIRITSLPNGEQRRVAIRHTKDGWMSFTKQPARFFQTVKSAENSEKSRKGDKKNKSSEHVSHDLYCFEIAVDRHSPGVQFLITSCDSRGKAEFEDNNDGNNYTVINPNYVAPREDDEEEAGWNSWMNDDNEWCNDYY